LASSHAIAKWLPRRGPHDAERNQAKVLHVISSVELAPRRLDLGRAAPTLAVALGRGGGYAADQRGLHNRAV
jgi:hypothetical protein